MQVFISGGDIDTSCQEEMINHRRMLLENYQLSPDLVVACKSELKRMCGGGKEVGGRTLHCLMKHARHSRKGDESRGGARFSPHCKRMVEQSVKVSDAGEDWRVDPVLHEACMPVVERSCSAVIGGQARVIRCLMKLLGTPMMTSPCEAALLEIQYFIARDWKLDPQLYNACLNDSVSKCHAKNSWASQDTDPERGFLVLPCLFRMTYHPNPDHRISASCSDEVRRIMHERAAYVDLHPEIEASCMQFLATYCSDRTQPGEELYCLQQNLDKVSADCKNSVGNYTEAEALDYRLNNLITVHCATLIPELCEEESRQSRGEGAVMDCLVQHKNSPTMRENNKCRAVIENFQIITLKEISFSPKFKKECHQDVLRFCSRSKTKKEVVDCLSRRVRDDLLADDRPQVSRGCRVQLRNQLLQRHSSIRLDPELQKTCNQDTINFCSSEATSSPDMVLECLRKNHLQLSQPCHEVVFKRTQEEILDPGTDPLLLQVCHQMIKLHCSNANNKDLLMCLSREKYNPGFSKKCRKVVVSRLIEQNSDVRLNPDLIAQCKMDIGRHCSDVFKETNHKKTELNGRLIDCLQIAMSKKKLLEQCEAKVVSITREAAINSKMDAQLQQVCHDEVSALKIGYICP